MIDPQVEIELKRAKREGIVTDPGGVQVPVVEEHGAGFRIQTGKFWVKAFRPRRYRDATYCRIEVSYPDGRLVDFDDRLNISSNRTRKAYADHLAKKLSVPVDWVHTLDSFGHWLLREADGGSKPQLLYNGQRDLKRVSYLVDPVIVKDEITMLYGDGGAMKSTLGLVLALAAASRSVQPFQTDHQVPVLYLDWESTYQSHSATLGRLCQATSIENPPIYYKSMTKALADAEEEVLEARAEIRAGFVIIDSVGCAVSTELNQAEAATGLSQACRRLRSSILAIHHVTTNAAQAESGIQRPYGSVYFWNMVRSAWEIRTQEGETPSSVLFHRKMNNDRKSSPIALEWHFSHDGLAMLPADSIPATLSQFQRRQDQIIAALEQGPMATSDLAEFLELPRGSISRELQSAPEVFDKEPGHRGRWFLRKPSS